MKRIMFFLFVVSFGCARNRSSSGITRFRSFHSSNEAARPSPVTIWPAKYGSQTSSSRIAAAPVAMMSEEMRKLQDVLPPEIRMVSFTVDPSRDTAEVLAKYAQKFGADENRWWFLTGERQALYDLSIKGFKLALEDTGGTRTEPITHSTRFALVDRRE